MFMQGLKNKLFFLFIEDSGKGRESSSHDAELQSQVESSKGHNYLTLMQQWNPYARGASTELIGFINKYVITVIFF